MSRSKFNGPWGRGKFGGFGRRHTGWGAQPPVNIEETATDFIVSLFAAGLQKEQVTLTVKDDILTISYPGANAETDSSAGAEGA